MAIVQWYKGQAVLGGVAYPIPEGGANLSWDRNIQAPAIAGNFAQMNFIEGVQMPSMDLQHKMLESFPGILDPTLLNAMFMTRTTDYQDDIASTTGAFFDGFSGWSPLRLKGQAWSLSTSKSAGVAFSTSHLVYCPPGDSVPSIITANPHAYTPFTGAPVHFQGLSYSKNGVAFDGINAVDITYSNNCTADMSMVGAGPQSVFPVDVNVGMPSATARVVFQADAVQHLADGDAITVSIVQGSVAINFGILLAVPSDFKGRSIGSGRQMRQYTCRVMGVDNSASARLVSIS